MSHDKAEHELQKEKESELRDRIFENPSLLPGFDKPAAAAKEVPVRRAGSADVVVVGVKGQIAIVECKRASNPQSRRYVIGQVFEYAAGLWKCDYEDFKTLLAACGATLGEEWGEERFQLAVTRNLDAGHFQVFIAVDEMTQALEKRLNRTVTLLNSQLPNVQFLAVAVPRGGGRAEPYGGHPEAIKGLTPRRKRDLRPVIDEIDSEVAARVAEELFEWAERMESRGVTVKPPTQTQVTIKAGDNPLFRVKLSGEVRVSLSGVVAKGEPWNEATTQLVQQLEGIGFGLEGSRDPWGRRPEAPLELLDDDRTRDEFLKLMERHLKTLAS